MAVNPSARSVRDTGITRWDVARSRKSSRFGSLLPNIGAADIEATLLTRVARRPLLFDQ